MFTWTADWIGVPTIMLCARQRWADFIFWESSDPSMYAASSFYQSVVVSASGAASVPAMAAESITYKNL